MLPLLLLGLDWPCNSATSTHFLLVTAGGISLPSPPGGGNGGKYHQPIGTRMYNCCVLYLGCRSNKESNLGFFFSKELTFWSNNLQNFYKEITKKVLKFNLNIMHGVLYLSR
jgi:hypothetical protein